MARYYGCIRVADLDNPDCTWTYRDGMFVSNRDQSLAINAWNGARHGAVLRLHSLCSIRTILIVRGRIKDKLSVLNSSRSSL